MDHYLGAWPENRRKPPPEVQKTYGELIAEWLAAGRILRPTAGPVTVAQILDAFWRYVEQHYRGHDGKPTNEQSEFRFSLRPLRHLYGDLPATGFSPLKLCKHCGLEYPDHKKPPNGEWKVLPGKVPGQGEPPWYDLPDFFTACPSCGASLWDFQ